VPESASLAHRHLLGQPVDYAPFAGTDLLVHVGGQATVDRLVDLLYDGFEADPALRSLFGRDLAAARASQKLFFAQWLGGSHRYAEQSYSGLAHQHESVPITRALADRWLHSFRQALIQSVIDEADRRVILDQASAVARALVNEEDAPAARQPAVVEAAGTGRRGPPRRRAIAPCGKAAGAVSAAVRLAQRGDAIGLGAALDKVPRSAREDLCSAPDAGRGPRRTGSNRAAAPPAWRWGRRPALPAGSSQRTGVRAGDLRDSALRRTAPAPRSGRADLASGGRARRRVHGRLPG